MKRKIEHLTEQEAEDNEPELDNPATEIVEEIAESLNQLVDTSGRMADALEHWAMSVFLASEPKYKVSVNEFNHATDCPLCMVMFDK